MREAILEISELRLTQKGRSANAQKLFDYIISNEFQSRFKAIETTVGELKALTDREKNWHEDTWTKREGLHDQIASARREVHAKIKASTIGAHKKAKLKVVRA